METKDRNANSENSEKTNVPKIQGGNREKKSENGNWTKEEKRK